MANITNAVNIGIRATTRTFRDDMMAAAASVTDFQKSVNNNFASVFRAGDKLNNQFKATRRFGEELSSVGKSLAIGLTLPLTLLAGQASQSYAEISRLEKGIIAVEGSSKLASVTMKELVSVAKLPGLGIEEANKFYLALRNVNVAGETSIRIAKAFGNAVASGGGGKAQFDSIATQLPQLLAKNKVTAEDLKPIINASPSVSKILNQLYGSVSSEDIQKKLEKQGKTAREFVAELTVELEKLPKVSGSYANALENIGDSLKIFGASVGKAADESFGLTEKIDGAANTLTDFADTLDNTNPSIKTLALSVAGLAAGVPIAITALGGIIQILGTPWKTGFASATTALRGFGSLLSANPLLIYGAGLSALALTFKAYTDSLDSTIDKESILNDVKRNSIRNAESERQKILGLVKVAKNKSEQDNIRANAIKQLNELSPKYLGGLTLENIALEKSTIAVQTYIGVLQKQAQAQLLITRIAQNGLAQNDVFMKEPTFFERFMGGIAGGGKYFIDKRLADFDRLKKEGDLLKSQLDRLKTDLGSDFTPTVGNLDMGAGSKPDKSEEAKKLAEKRVQLEATTLKEIAKLQIQSIDDEKLRREKEIEFEIEEEIKAKRKEYEEVKKPLDESYFKWEQLQYSLKNDKLLAIQKDFFLKNADLQFSSLKNIGSGRSAKELADSILGADSDKIVEVPKKLMDRMNKGISSIQDSNQTTFLASMFGVSEEEVAKNLDKYKKFANSYIDANASMKGSLESLAASAIQNTSIIIGEMITGTATIKDLANSLLGSIGSALADIAKFQIITGLASGNIAQILGGVAAGVGSGIFSGLAKKTQTSSQPRTSYANYSQVNGGYIPQVSVNVTGQFDGKSIVFASNSYQTFRNGF